MAASHRWLDVAAGSILAGDVKFE
uniref:Uncharacterized protein n=1 Tax=Nelumbo nucifera TaxID=4432 RepID=A0A822XKK6_NELNU|nr:TPA_asm: hypothetical protein HUJ06_021082 [Nelumbo nucifera]